MRRDSIGGQANPDKTETTEAEPVVVAYVRIHGSDIDPHYCLDTEANRRLLVAGAEIHAKVRCGNHALGYALFYSVWEYFYEKVIFGWL